MMILADGVMGQAMEPVVPTYRMPAPRSGGWELTGADGRPPRVVRSLHLQPEDLEAHNRQLQAKFAAIAEREVRWADEQLDDAEIAIVAYGTAAGSPGPRSSAPASTACAVGLFRPITLWPFPSGAAGRRRRSRLRAIVVVELSAGQMVEDVRLAVGGRSAGLLPRPDGRHGPDARRGRRRPAPGLGDDRSKSAAAGPAGRRS